MSSTRAFALVLLVAALPSGNVVFAQCQIDTLRGADTTAGDGFGAVLSVSGERMAVASPVKGCVYMFVRTPGGWVEEAKLLPADWSASQYFGRNPSLHGDRLIVGAQGDEHAGPRSGAAYVFRLQDGAWVEEAKLVAADAAAEREFGLAAGIHDDVAVVGSWGSGAYVFRRQGTSWSQEANITVAPYTYLGTGVATDGQSIVLADVINDVVLIYSWTGSVWTLDATFSRPGQATGSAAMVSIGGDLAIAGAPLANGFRGEVSTYRRSGGAWSEHSVLTPSDDAPDQLFGVAVSLTGDTLVVGAKTTPAFGSTCDEEAGAAYVFRFDGSSWDEQLRLVPTDPEDDDFFGAGVGAGSDFVVAGAPGDDRMGGAFLFSLTDGADCNANSVNDGCELLLGIEGDCNGNSVLDSCDIALGTSQDCTLDGQPDECDPDCNGNGTADSCDLAGSSADCNNNEVPDECEPPFECAPARACEVATSGFGGVVAMDQNWAVTLAGALVTVFQQVGTGWVQQSLFALPGNPYEPNSNVAMSGDRFVVTFGDTFVYRRNGSNWQLEATLPGDAPVAIDGDVLVSGSLVYRRNGSSWNPEVVLSHGDPTPNDEFGSSVDVDGDYAVVGAPNHGNIYPQAAAGAAYVFRREGGTWDQVAKLTSSQPGDWARFGHSVAMDGAYLVVGEPESNCDAVRPGRASVFKRVGESWTEVAAFVPSGYPNEGYGSRVSMDGRRMLIGAPYAYPNAGSSNTGAVDVFELEPGGQFWIRKDRLSVASPSGTNTLGFSNAVSGRWALLNSSGAQKSHFFAVGEDCNANGVVDICDIRAGTGPDANNDGLLDVCLPCPQYAPPPWASGPIAEPHPVFTNGTHVPKNRYVSFIPPATPAGATSLALRVTLTSMPGPFDCPKVPDFSAFNGTVMWVGPEAIVGGSPTGVYPLQSTPHFRDWSTVGCSVVHVADCNIVPCATYTVEALTDDGQLGPALAISTAGVWGDVVGPGGASPDGIVNAIDIVTLVDRYKDLPGAAPRNWCDIDGNRPTQGLRQNINALDITTIVNTFKGFDYPFGGPSAPAPCPP